MDTDLRNPRPPYEEMVGFATRAPSVHNTQPWLWRTSAEGLELFADWSRQLSRADPDGRDVLVSCGAALHHLWVAAAALGWTAHVEHTDPSYPRLLASVRFTRRDASAEAGQGLSRLLARQTDRRQFASWPVPQEQLQSLRVDRQPVGRHRDPGDGRSGAAAPAPAHGGGGRAPATRPRLRDRAGHLGARAGTRRRPRRQRAGRGRPDPGRSTRWSRSGSRPGRLVDERRDPLPSPPGILVIATSSDDVLSRVRAGEALSAVWLDATGRGLVGVPLSQATEVDNAGCCSSRVVSWDDRACPQILFCVGWPQADRSPLPHTPRRPVTQVMIRAD